MKMKSKTIFIAIIFCAFFSWAENSEAKNLYVNNSGSPPCSDATTYIANDANNPWCNISRASRGSIATDYWTYNASEAADAGDTVLVTAGTYHADNTPSNRGRWGVLYNPVNTGTVSAPIVFQAVGEVILTNTGVGPVIGASGDTSVGGSSARDYITWKGFTINEIDNTVASDTGPVVLHVTTGTIIENCVINGNVDSPLANNHNGIRIEASTDCVIRNNIISNVLNGCPTCYGGNGACIMTYGSKDGIYEYNEFYNCGTAIFLKSGLQAVGGYPDKNNNSIVRYNYMENPGVGGRGIYIGMIEGISKVYQNIVKGFSAGIYASSLTSQALLGDVYMVNNTIIDPTSTSESSAINFNGRDGSTANFIIQNNIMHKATNYIGVFAPYWDDASYFAFDYNVYSNVNSWRVSGTSDATLAAWRIRLGGAGAGNDNNSVISDPAFVSYASDDYKLQGGSPALTLGVDILDLDGDLSTTDTIPAGAYITGRECIGLESSCGGADITAPSAPSGLSVQ